MIPEMMTTEEVIEREVAAGQPFGPFHRYWLNQRAPEKVRRMLELASERPGLVAVGANVKLSTIAMPVSAAAVNTTVAETNLWVPANWTPIQAFDMAPGKSYCVRYGGIIQTTATPTYIFTPRVGQSATPASNVTLGAGPTVTAGTIPASSPFYGEMTFSVRAVDVAYTAITGTGNGYNVVAAAAATAHQVSAMGGAVPTNISNTAASGLIVSITWGTSSASNTITIQWTDMDWD